jgi:hypothetical protein
VPKIKGEAELRGIASHVDRVMPRHRSFGDPPLTGKAITTGVEQRNGVLHQKKFKDSLVKNQRPP